MEQKEVKKNMTAGQWHIISGQILADDAICQMPSLPMDDSDSANAAAICHAVNNTYGQNIDPTKVPEMVHMLKTVLSYEAHISELYPDITALLNSISI